MIRVLVVDDSALMRNILVDILSADSRLEVVDTAANAHQARAAIKRLNPDVMTLDVEMPGMDGLSFLSNLMRLRPMPVVMVSTFTARGAATTLKALELGAYDVVEKPTVHSSDALSQYAEELTHKVYEASLANVEALRPARANAVGVTNAHENRARRPEVVAVGASTGGTEALRYLVSCLPADAPALIVAQHIPPQFSASFAERLDASSAMVVREARADDVIQAGHVYIAPGDHHLTVVGGEGQFTCQLDTGVKVNRHRPSVDVLFESVSEHVGARAIGILLTGMGSDGARGMCALRAGGAKTIAQDEATSVVWGMPRAAIRSGGAEAVMALPNIATYLCGF
ncbi:MAG: chemotaxis response regulator protein-glutamate methylesterase [Gammaproteobacteria bacterium]|nr:chemotaxis response regulator protein-glutamate methylesterase [Gammaproteobacteria bacterium]